MIIKNVFNRILKKAGLEQVDELGEKLTAHSLRHTYGTAQAEAGVSSFVIQNLMRHTAPRTTAKYTKRAVQGGMIIDPLNMLNGQKDEEEDKGEDGMTDSKTV